MGLDSFFRFLTAANFLGVLRSSCQTFLVMMKCYDVIAPYTNTCLVFTMSSFVFVQPRKLSVSVFG